MGPTGNNGELVPGGPRVPPGTGVVPDGPRVPPGTTVNSFRVGHGSRRERTLNFKNFKDFIDFGNFDVFFDFFDFGHFFKHTCPYTPNTSRDVMVLLPSTGTPLFYCTGEHSPL